MKIEHIAIALLLILAVFVLGAKQERERLLEWFEDLDWYWQVLIGTAIALLILLSAAYLVAPYFKSLI